MYGIKGKVSIGWLTTYVLCQKRAILQNFTIGHASIISRFFLRVINTFCETACLTPLLICKVKGHSTWKRQSKARYDQIFHTAIMKRCWNIANFLALDIDTQHLLAHLSKPLLMDAEIQNCEQEGVALDRNCG